MKVTKAQTSTRDCTICIKIESISSYRITNLPDEDIKLIFYSLNKILASLKVNSKTPTDFSWASISSYVFKNTLTNFLILSKKSKEKCAYI